MLLIFSSLVLSVFQVEDARSIMSRFIFDTGAGLCFLFNENFLNDSSFLKNKNKKFITQTEGFGGKKEMELTVIKSISVGPYKFRKVPVFIFKDAFNVTSYPQSCGLIGNDLLKRFNVVLNYPERTIYLKPNNRFSENFDYSYTGLGIYLVDDTIKVIDIIKDSPGDIAGFKRDDILIGIDNHFTNNIQTFKTALQNAGARLKVFIIRNQQPVTLYLSVKNILIKSPIIKQILISPYKEIFRHFDGYYHQYITNNQCPALDIPPGFFENDIKRMTQKLKMGVKVSLKTKNKGSVLISFNNIEEYNKIIKKLTSDK